MLLAERIGKLLLYRDAAAAHDPNVIRELVDIWQILGKDLCSTCQDKLYSAMTELRKINLTAMSKRVSQIKDGEFIMVPFTSDSYTNANLTDAIARRMLKEYPALASSFKKLPPDEPVEGDEDYVDPNAPKAKATEPGPSLDELKAENEKLKAELTARNAATAQPADSKTLPESSNTPQGNAGKPEDKKDKEPVKDAK